MLHYAVAELQNAVGLIEDRDKTVLRALAIEPGQIQTSEPIPQFGLQDGLLMNEHYHVGLHLKQCFRLRWAIAHFQKVMKTGDISLHIYASTKAAESAIYLEDYVLAIALLDEHIEILRGPDHARGDAESLIIQAQRQQAYCLAKKAAAVENWEGVRESIMQAWTTDTSNSRDLREAIDMLVIAYRLSRHLPDTDSEFKDMMDSQLRRTWNSIVAIYDNALSESRQAAMVLVCNAAAWLLANMDGDYQDALTLVEAALKVKPDSIAALNTLAHVYFLGGKANEAIRVQEQVVRFAPEAVIFQRALERFRAGIPAK
jgi:tetratricopeptide (TPR) repeat protein